jgi:acetylornithine deacetylase
MLDDTLKILDDLIAFESVALTPNLDLIDYVVNYLEPLGARLTLTHSPDQTKANLFATLGPEGNGGIVLSGHSDVVPVDPADWATPPFTTDYRQGRVYGRGTADMKGFIACVLAMAPRYAALDLKRPLHIALTFDEEDGFHGAPILLEELVRNGPTPAAVIIGEPTGLRVVGAHKGCFEYTTTFTGMNGHSSLPDQAVSAVHYAVRFVARLLDLGAALPALAPTDSPYNPPSSTVNAGVISGGIARCTVAGDCVVEWEMRPIQDSDADFVRAELAATTESLMAEMRQVCPEASIETETVCEVRGLALVEGSPALSLMGELLGESPVEVVSYGTEAGLYQTAGVPAVVWGPGDIEVAHKPDESVALSDLEACLEALEKLGLDILTKTL